MKAEAPDRVTDLSGASKLEAGIRQVKEAVSNVVEDGEEARNLGISVEQLGQV